MVSLIQRLLDKGYAYRADEGIYFSIDKFKGYGALTQLKKAKKKKACIRADEYDKEHVHDFALWKFWSPEDGNAF